MTKTLNELLDDLRIVHAEKHKNKPYQLMGSQIAHIHSEASELFEDIRAMHALEVQTPIRGFKREEMLGFLDEQWDIIYSAITSMFLLSASNEEIIEGMEKCLTKIQNRAFGGLPPDLGRSQ